MKLHSVRLGQAWALVLALVLALLFATTAQAQPAWPARPVKGINPFAAGGPSDVLGRLIGDRLTQRLGQPFVMENRPGAAGNIGIDAMAKSAPDGYTLAWVVDFNLTVNPALYPKMPYSVERDIQPIAVFAMSDVALVVHPTVAANSLVELIALLKVKSLAFASAGPGSPGHMVGEMFKRELGLELMNHVPYKGNAPATLSVVSGETQVFFGALPGSLTHIKAGKLKPLAVMSRERSKFIPEVATSVELGYPKLLASNWYGLIAPAGTPIAIVDRLHRELTAIVAEREFVERIEKMGLVPLMAAPEQMRNMIRTEGAAWAAVVRAANIKVE